VRQNSPLSVRQVQVLQWISDGCPDGAWSDFSYKTTTYALAARGLVAVDRRHDQWSATTTERGEFYLAHGSYPTGPDDHRSRAVDASEAIDELASQIVEDLTARNGELVIRDPDPQLRARYRRAINRLITNRQIPSGFGLRHTGRDRGDLTIRLIALADDSKQPDPPPRVWVPDTMDEVTPAVRALGEGERLAVTPDSRDRALLITQAIADQCTVRGWAFTPSPNGERGFRITAGECSFDFTLTEELVDQEIHDNQTLQAAKYPWQRVPLKVAKVGSGRLTLMLDAPFSRRTWSDRKRWSLDDKLGAAFAELQSRVADAEEKRRRAEEDLVRRQQEWDAAVSAAKHAYIVDLNRRRVREQVSKYGEAQALRAYAKELQDAADGADSQGAQVIRRWAMWARSEASRVDPLNDVSELAYVEQDEITPADFDRFMPRGMNAHRRPNRDHLATSPPASRVGG
jgi:hypothetical protein